MRRPFALALSTLALAGCAGADGQRAHEILRQSQQAEKQLRSMTYEALMTISAGGRSFGFTMDGGGTMRAGKPDAQYIRMRGSGMPELTFEATVVARDGRAWMAVGKDWHEVPLPAGLDQAFGSFSLEDLAPYVKNVSVYEGEQDRGEPVTVIAGDLDTAGMVKAFARMNGLSQAAGGSAALDDVTDKLGDIRALISVSDRTRYVTSAVITLKMDVPEAGEMAMRFSYRLTSVNKPIVLPKVGR